MVHKVLVTGGSGFIGRRVIQRFLDRGWTASSFSLPGETPPPGWSDRVTRHEGDIAQATDAHQRIPSHEMQHEKVSSKSLPFLNRFPIKYCLNLYDKSRFLVYNSPKGTMDAPGVLSVNMMME